MISKRHKITNVPLFKKIWDIICFFETITFLAISSDCPAKKNYVPKFLKQQDINSYLEGKRIVNISTFDLTRHVLSYFQKFAKGSLQQQQFLIMFLHDSM